MRNVGWFLNRNRAITAATGFVLLVILALIVAPVVTSEFARSSHAHIRELVDPLDQEEQQVSVLVSRMEDALSSYVISGNQVYLESYQESTRKLGERLLNLRMLAGRLGPEALRLVDELDQSIRRWQQFADPVFTLRQEGRVEEAQTRLAAGNGADLINDFQQKEMLLHQYIADTRNDDRDRLDQTLNAQVLLSLILGALGILAGILVVILSRRIAILYEEVRMQHNRVAELAQQERRRAGELDTIIEDMAEGLVVADQAGQIVRLNRVARQIWRLPWPEEQQGDISEVAKLDLRYPDGRPVPPEDLPIKRALRGETFSGQEAVYHRSDGTRFDLQFGGGAVRDETGKVILAVTVFHDITAIRQLEQQREEFISVVAHDLRNPITIITGYASMLSRLPLDQHNTDQERKAVHTIATSAHRLERMVADLLDASRIEAKRLTLTKEEIDLPKLVREIIERETKIVKDHPVRVEVEGTVRPVLVDPSRFEQILANLLSNAAKYSYPETEILIEIEHGQSGVVVSVTNHGSGIPPEDRSSLFTRFHRTRTAREGKVPGLGLGLYITRGLVEAHGGRIWVESEAGRYAAFFFTLPLKPIEYRPGK